ncbi:MAG: phosphate acyltransferase PlsX [Bacilli bacterium]|nr:phosphate acyltransferase PlsX [Bacilli bacterium]
MVKLIVDMMGSDLGSAATKEGVRRFKANHPDCELVLVGKLDELADMEGYEKIEANDTVGMTAGAMEVLRKRDASMVKAVRAAADPEMHADGVISAGGTGAFLSAATLILKKINGVKRPALVTAFPKLTDEGGYVTILDCGSSNENTAEELQQFALMGSLYSKAVYGIENPRVGLVANGSEEGKGSPLGKEAYALLKEDKKINFIGNVEGNQVLTDYTDVVVCDGFTGNVLLKTTEGVAKGMGKEIKKAFTRNLASKIGYLFARKSFNVFIDKMNPKKTGGALLLGVNGVAVKAHGNSDGENFESALNVAYKLAVANIVAKMQEGFVE